MGAIVSGRKLAYISSRFKFLSSSSGNQSLDGTRMFILCYRFQAVQPAAISTFNLVFCCVFILLYRFGAIQPAATSLLRMQPILRRSAAFSKAPANRAHLTRLQRLRKVVPHRESRPSPPNNPRRGKTPPVLPMLQALSSTFTPESARSETWSARTIAPVFALREILQGRGEFEKARDVPH